MKPIAAPFMAVVLAAMLSTPATAQEPSSRLLDELNWLEIRQLVPEKIKTVILTTGTVEPHGVTNNGTDNIIPAAIAGDIAADVNAIIAPHIPYGVTGSMAPYPGAAYIPPEVYGPYVEAVLVGFKKNGFRNIVIINGHGGPQTAVLQEVAGRVALREGVNTLVINWWSTCADAAVEVFGNTGGHGAENETAMVQAIDPELVHKDLLSTISITPTPPSGTWAAVPFPSTITLYEPGKGAPHDFDQAKADAYYAKVVEEVRELVLDTIRKWEMAGF